MEIYCSRESRTSHFSSKNIFMIKDQLQGKINEALKSGDALKTSTYRMLLSALKYEEIAKQHELSDEEEIVVIKRQVKQREEAREAYEKAGRVESAEKEKKEAEVLGEFLPEQISREEIERLSDEVIEGIGDVGPQDFGKVMQAVMAKLKGQADGKIVSEIVRNRLSAQVK